MMRMVNERTAAYVQLAADLKRRPARKADRELIDELIGDETESREKALERLRTVQLGPAQKKAQQSGADNCAEVIKLLQVARRNLKDSSLAVPALLEAAEHRNKKRAARPKPSSLWNRYAEYLAQTDPDFHAWMISQGHEEELKLGLAQ